MYQIILLYGYFENQQSQQNIQNISYHTIQID